MDVKAAYPVNLRVIKATDTLTDDAGNPLQPTGPHGNSVSGYHLHVNYTFESSSGRRADCHRALENQPLRGEIQQPGFVGC